MAGTVPLIPRHPHFSMFDALDHAIMAVDAAGCIVLLNRPFARLLEEWGLPAAEPEERLVGQPVAQLLAGSPELARVAEAIGDVLARRRSGFEIELTHGEAEAGRQWVFHVRPAPAEGPPELAMISGLNITEQRRAESQVLLAQKHEAVGRLAAGVAHDFNNLIQGIIGHLELIEGALAPESTPPLVRDSLAQIDRAAMRAAELVCNLVSFSRTISVAPVELDLNEVIARTRAMVDHMLGPAVQLETLLEPDLPRIHGNFQQVQQVVLNVVLNARDAMPDGGRLTIRTAREPEATAAGAMLEVRDSGVGIDPALHDKIFDPYFTTKEYTKGSGLGLAVVYRIIEQMRARIVLDSALGRGTTLQIIFPPVRGAGAVDRDGPGREGRPSRRALVAEHETMMLEVNTRVMRQLGFEVTGCTDGAQAWDEVRRQSPDHFGLIMLDLALPGIQGLELHRLIEGHSPGGCYIFTGHALEPATRRTILQIPRVRLLDKPTRPGELIQSISELYGPVPIE